MTQTASSVSAIDTVNDDAEKQSAANFDLPYAYDSIRADTKTQFEPLALSPPEPREPSWIEQALQAVFDWLGESFGPVGGAIAAFWPVLQWILIAALAGFVLYLAARLVGPMAKRGAQAESGDEVAAEWKPTQRESLALLEDADALAAQERYDEAVHLLLKRSVGQIADAKPDWVSPSSTARELAALPRLSQGARDAFALISAVVESSLFALQRLSRGDWERARQAYADFALANITAQAPNDRNPS